MAFLCVPKLKSGSGFFFKISILLILAFSAAPLLRAEDEAPLAPTAPTPRPHDFVPRPIYREPHTVLPPTEVAAALDAFFKGLEQSDTRKSYAALLTGSRMVNHDEDLDAFVQKTQQAFSVYGKMTEYEVYDTRTIGTRLLVTTYLSAQAVAPLRWRFIWYKADKNWTLLTMVFDDSMQDLLE